LTQLLAGPFDPFFDKKLEDVVDGLPLFFKKSIITLLHKNAKLVVDFINSEVQYNNIKITTKRNKIQAVTEFIKFWKKKHGYEISLMEVVREDFIEFQTNLHKSEQTDPFHKWVSTYNQFLRNIKPFFKWLFHPNEEPKNRTLLEFLAGINQLYHKERTTYSADDMCGLRKMTRFLKNIASIHSLGYIIKCPETFLIVHMNY
jgi:hypothetical protein